MRNVTTAAIAALAFLSTTALSTEKTLAADSEVQQLKREIQNLQDRLSALEEAKKPTTSTTSFETGRNVHDNSFNPSIGVILNGQYRSFSADDGDIAGFAVGHEGERREEGFSVEHTELNFTANVDDKFTASATAAIAEHEGETEVELEEAYIQTLPGIGLPSGASIKAGRAFWTIGYLNEHHSHADDFADRPLPYRVFLDNAFNDDGVEFSYVLPVDFYSEIGGGVFRGNDNPFGAASGDDFGAWSAYLRFGGDIGDNQSWRLGGYVLSGESDGRETNEDEVIFAGDSDLYVADFRYTWAPTGNPRAQELLLQGEYFHRDEDGTYEDLAAGTGAVAFDDASSGWYAQAVYKFHPQWRIGTRVSQLEAADTPAGLAGSALDAGGHDPKTYAVMMDWTNSEFSRLRLQYNREEVNAAEDDDQLLLQYVVSIGAHGAHKY